MKKCQLTFLVVITKTLETESIINSSTLCVIGVVVRTRGRHRRDVKRHFCRIARIIAPTPLTQSAFFYIRCILVHVTFSTPSWYTDNLFGTLELFLVIFGTFGVDVTFGTPVTFGRVTLVTLFSHARHNPDEFWYFWCILVYVTFGTPVGTLHQ